MANFTREAIKNSFLNLLETHPLDRITVKDVAAGCGVNRNTFYYYFQDIPTLAEEIVEDDAEAIIKKHPRVDSIRQCMDAALEFAQAHRRTVMHLFQSTDRAAFEWHLWRVCRHTVERYVENLLESSSAPGEDMEVLIHYQVCAAFGMAMDWIENGMREDLRGHLGRVSELYQSMFDQLLRRKD